ncbi:hypothetical protein [Fusibacter bizertensis]
MADRQLALKIQKVASFALYLIAGVLFVFSLGFMTNFYQLFIDGNSEMYKFYKDLQMLNTMIFDLSVILVILTLLHFAFDFHKRMIGLGGVIVTLTTTILNISNGIAIFQTNAYFKNEYLKIDFSGMANYNPSAVPFNLTYIIFSLVIAISALVTIVSCFNFVRNYRK